MELFFREVSTMTCVVLTREIIKTLNSFDKCCDRGKVCAAMTALINPCLTGEGRETLLEEFGEHLRMRLLLLWHDVHPCHVIHFYTLAPCARKAFAEEVKKSKKEAYEALICLCEVEAKQDEYEHLIRRFVAQHRKVTVCGQTIH